MPQICSYKYINQMEMRIKIDSDITLDSEIELEGENLKILRARKNRCGEIITITNSKKKDFRGRISEIGLRKARIFVFEKLKRQTESNIEITLLQAIPEKERFELIIQKVTELGVTRIVPFKSSRSISLKEREKKQKKSHRWPDIALRASMQCRRASVPGLIKCSSFKKALTYSRGDDLKILLWEKEAGKSLKDILKNDKRYNKISILVGPEGGFTEREVSFATRMGFKPVRLGQRILRTETAAIVSVAIVQNLFGDLN